MTRTQKVVTAMALMLFAATGRAAQPTSIVFDTYAETDDGRPYARFTVRCNDGRKVPLTAWEGHRKWCVGEVGKLDTLSCEKKQISAAKSACLDA